MMTGSRLLSAIEAPGWQLGVVATGLTAVVGSTFWQVLWMIAVVVMVVVLRHGSDDGSGGSGGGGGGGGQTAPPGPQPRPGTAPRG